MANRRKILSANQFEAVSEISGNIAVAWFAGGVIAPVFLRPTNLIDFSLSLGWGLTMTAVFTYLAIYFAGGNKNG